jgi:6-phosphogluconolactonase
MNDPRNTGELKVYDGPADVAAALADLFIDRARRAIDMRDGFSVSLAGGSTPKAAYARLAQASGEIDWSKVQIFFGDERCVPPDNEQSNYRMAREAFLSAVGIPASNIYRMRGEDDPTQAALRYHDVLTGALGKLPRLDLVMLGMGPDGHTASLFPGSDPLADNEALVRAVYSQSQAQWRITLTPAVLNAGRTIVFAVEGAAKTATLKDVRDGPYDPIRYPSQIISPQHGELLWLTDRAAAGVMS